MLFFQYDKSFSIRNKLINKITEDFCIKFHSNIQRYIKAHKEKGHNIEQEIIMHMIKYEIERCVSPKLSYYNYINGKSQ